MSSCFSLQINAEAYIKSFDPVVEGYICIETPILCPWPVNYYSQYEYNQVDFEPILDKFISAKGRNWIIWLDKEVAYKNFKYFRDFYWSSGIKTTSWAVVKVSLDKELIGGVLRQRRYYQGRSWPLVLCCPVVYCLEYVFHGMGSRPDIMESREEQEKWNEKAMNKTISKKEIFNKRKKN
jgi:hypothetical protein